MKPYFLLAIVCFMLFEQFASATEKKAKDPVIDPCLPFSTLACSSVQVSLPYSLNFNASVSETLTDKNNLGTGFTMALPYSGTRLAADGNPNVANVPGYDPTNITVSQGRLSMVTHKGIDFLGNNNQINVLGVKVLQSGKLNIEVSLINPINGTQSQQAGVWFGLNDRNFIKLTISGNKVELRRETNDISSSIVGAGNPDQRVTPVITGLDKKNVRLRLTIDSASQTAEGFYSVDGGNNYKSTGAAYPVSNIKLNGMGVTGTLCYAAIYASHRNATTAVTYTFDDFLIKNDAPVIASPVLNFSADSLFYTFYKGGEVSSQSVILSSGMGAPNVDIKVINANWLTVPQSGLGTISLGNSNISSALAAGTYKGLIVASAAGFKSDTLGIRIMVVDGISLSPIYVNFQNAVTIPPANWVRDFGQAYGFRTAPYQSSGLQYGWRRKSDGIPFNITANGFNRNEPEDVSLATLIYMQANNVSTTFPGSKTASFWEIKVPNGTYDVSVSAGDGISDGNSESDNLKIENVSAITGFVPSGDVGSVTRFKQATLRVPVKDEHITITADGGTNTKINYAKITPVNISPYIGWTVNTINLLIVKGKTPTNTVAIQTGNSDNKTLVYTISATYNSGTAGWLSFASSQTGFMPTVVFNYAAAFNLPVGSYSAAIKSSCAGYTSAYTNIYLRVVDGILPYVISSSPVNAAIKVDPNTVSIAANHLSVPAVAGFKGGVDNATVTAATVKLFKVIDNVSTEIAGVVQGTGGGDAISFSPKIALETNTTYSFRITNGVKSYSGAAFVPYTSTFTTDSATSDTTFETLNVHFTKSAVPGTQNKKYTTLRFGPDGMFYALRLDGTIERYTVNHTDGTLSNQQLIPTLVNKYGGRSAIGLVFDPKSTALNLVCYVTHCSSGLVNSPLFDCNISKLSGNNLENETLFITKLPRSTRDHMANSLQFGPDSALYLSQGSNSSAGDYDNDWQRDESLLSGTVLRIDMAKMSLITLPLNVQTTSSLNVINAAPANSYLMSDGTYNPYSASSPVTIYASGVRNAYDLLWHSNGQLYIPTNGSGGGGNSPASVNGTRRPNGDYYNGEAVPVTTDVQVQFDWLFRVNPLKNIGYFGHPNPLRGQYVENRGSVDNPLYNTNIQPDQDYRGAAYNFGLNHSPNGVIEYKSNAFNNALKNKILVCRFSGGGDIMVLEPGSLTKTSLVTSANDNDRIYDIIKVTPGSGNYGLIGMSGFANPINLVEDTITGNLYVIEYNWNANAGLATQITLLKVNETSTPPTGLLSLFSTPVPDENGLIAYKSYDVQVANKGDGDLKIKKMELSGDDISNFNIEGIILPEKDKPLILKKNSNLSFTVRGPADLSFDRNVKLRVTSVEDSVKVITFLTRKSAGIIDKDTIKVSRSQSGPTLKVYPNPNTGEWTHILLENYKILEKVNISLFDIVGNKIKSIDLTTDLQGYGNITLQLPKVQNTSHFIIRAVSSSGSKEAKLIVNN